MIYTWTYSNDGYEPSAPVIRMTLQGASEIILDIAALVDSGSDATAIPLNQLRRVNARKVAQARMSDIHGLSRLVNLYDVTIQLGHLQMRVDVIGDKVNKQAIIGRDILNHLPILLNGPASTTEINTEL